MVPSSLAKLIFMVSYNDNIRYGDSTSDALSY